MLNQMEKNVNRNIIIIIIIIIIDVYYLQT